MPDNQCNAHEPLLEKLSELTEQIIEQRRDQGWLIRIGYGLFMLGLALMTLALAAIFQAGSLKAVVERNAQDIARVEQNLHKVEVEHAPKRID